MLDLLMLLSFIGDFLLQTDVLKSIFEVTLPPSACTLPCLPLTSLPLRAACLPKTDLSPEGIKLPAELQVLLLQFPVGPLAVFVLCYQNMNIFLYFVNLLASGLQFRILLLILLNPGIDPRTSLVS